MQFYLLLKLNESKFLPWFAIYCTYAQKILFQRALGESLKTYSTFIEDTKSMFQIVIDSRDAKLMAQFLKFLSDEPQSNFAYVCLFIFVSLDREFYFEPFVSIASCDHPIYFEVATILDYFQGDPPPAKPYALPGDLGITCFCIFFYFCETELAFAAPAVTRKESFRLRASVAGLIVNLVASPTAAYIALSATPTNTLQRMLHYNINNCVFDVLVFKS